MFTPTKIELRNFGSIPHAVIEPHLTGITALDGPTGSGKSTLLNAVVFALYGYVGGVAAFHRQAELRFDLCPEGEPVEVAVEFSWDGAEFRVVRRLRRTKSGAEKAEAELWIDGVAQLNMSPDRLTEKMVGLTGMTGRAFTSAFFIPQNHLDKLAMGTPAEVQAVIEEQTGLTPLTAQIAVARADATQAQSVADAMPGSAEELEAAQATVDETQAAAVEVFADLATHQAATSRLLDVHTSAQSVLDGLLDRQQAATDARRALDAAAGRLEGLREQLAGIRTQLAAAPDLPSSSRIDTERQQLAGIVARMTQTMTVMDRNQRAAVTTEVALASAERAAETAGDEQIVERQAERAARRAADLAARHELLKQRWTEAMQHRNDLAVNNGNSTCPTCLQRVTDPAAALAEFSRILDSIKSDGSAVSTELEMARVEQKRASDAAVAAREAARAVQVAAMAHKQAKSALESARADAATVAAELETTGLDGLAGVRARIDELAVLATRAARAEQLREQQDTVTAAISSAERNLAERRTSQVAAVDEGDLEEARRDEMAARAELRAAQEVLNVHTLDAEHHRGLVDAAEAARDAAKARFEAKVGALEAADTARHAVAALVELRQHLLAQYTEVISDAATQIMERAGGGRHVGVIIDGRFTPEVVLADGRRRPFRLCSGGEKLRAALCLCLGQVELVSAGSRAGTLFADEIATGYDPDTTRAVMDVIAGLGRPMILIGHNPEVPQIANRVYRFSNTDDTGTVVTLAGERLAA